MGVVWDSIGTPSDVQPGPLGASWDALGTLWGTPGLLLVAPGPRLGDLGSILDPPRIDFGASEGRF